jgi:hypothetical protein
MLFLVPSPLKVLMPIAPAPSLGLTAGLCCLVAVLKCS